VRATGGAFVTTAVTVVSAVASVFMPSAASRPSRLGAVAQTSECDDDAYGGNPDRVAFPLQATVGESAWVGSIVLNAALVSVVVIAVVLLHCGVAPQS
jgi:hypothetical protein